MKGKCASWLGFLQPVFNFTASKYVFIKDWRLGVILRVLQVAILIYVLTDIFKKASYLMTEVPTGLVTVWPDGQSPEMKAKAFELQRQELSQGSLEYCENPEYYDFEWSGIEYGDFECAYLDSTSIFVGGESQVFVTTSFRAEKLHFYTQKTDGTCMTGPEVGEGVKQLTSLDNACVYTESRGYFPIQPESIRLNLLHSYRTSSIVNKEGSLPQTYISAPGFSDDHIHVNEGSQLNLKLEDLLKIAGVDLDKRLDEQENSPATDNSQGKETGGGGTQYPFARLSGVTLHVSFNYYTRRLAPSPHTKPTGKNADDVICLMDIKPQSKWSFVGADIRQMMNEPRDPLFLTPSAIAEIQSDQSTGPRVISSQTDFQRNGVTLVFSVSGSVGRFDVSALISALVAGSVLLAVAQAITTYVALYALGISSELYGAFMRENVDWRQEYARYAAQACVAGYAFMKYDSNSSMKLDRKEIFDVLKALLSKKKDMEDWQLAALADFLMRQGERGTDVDKGRFNAHSVSKESFIDIEEWIDIFTEDKAHWAALKRLIEHEYRDEESRQGVLDLLTRSTTSRKARGLSLIPGISEEGEEDVERDGTPEMSYRISGDSDGELSTPFLDRTSRSAPPPKGGPGRSSL